MWQYFLRRLLILIPVLAGISLVLFTILAMAPGDPFEELATNPNVPPEVRMNLRAKFGLDDPIAVRYVRWFSSMLRGDWGFSFASRVNVDTLILQRLPTSLFVLGTAQLLGILIALPIGTLSAVRPYSIFDQIATTLAFIGFSLPTFFTGILFILFFSIYLDWLPFIYRADISATGWRWWWEHARQAIMPVAVLGLAQGAALTRFVRSAVLDVIRLDYINTARAKGLAEHVTIIKHGVRNALIPVVTLVALQIPTIFTGAVITEQIFRVPGIGSLLISAILANDTPVIMAITFVFSCLVVSFSLVADLLYGWLDPRITYR
jgi:peptide/nickel transport system permease protein